MPTDPPRPLVWELYESPNGKALVRDEFRATLADKASLVALGQLMTRLQYHRTLPRDTRPLAGGLFEARLTDQGKEYRLYYALECSRSY